MCLTKGLRADMRIKIPSVYGCLAVLLCGHFVILLLFLQTLSISQSEAKIFFEANTLSSFLSHLSVKLLGQNDYALRLPFLLLHFCNTLLMFYLSANFLKRKSDALFATLLFCLLPGVNVAALFVSNVGIVIFFTLLLCVFEQKYQTIPYWLLGVIAFVDASFALLFLALIFYAITRKDTILLFVVLILFALNMYLYGLNIGGYPRGYFLDANGHLMLIFSPLLYLYFLYTLYRYFNVKTKPLMWYISFCALIFIALLSLRQRVQIEAFAPFLLVGIPLMVHLYFSGLRVRLPQFRMRYKIPFFATFFVLLCVYSTLIFSKPLFRVIPNANAHFAQRHFIAKELAQALHQNGITEVRTDEKMQLRLKFYGIQKGGAYLQESPKPEALKLPILYYGKTIATFYLQ